jgi:uncharacterized RDD family membrane protein YckC
MNCPQCGSLLRAEARFCGECGSSVLPVTAASHQVGMATQTSVPGRLFYEQLLGAMCLLTAGLSSLTWRQNWIGIAHWFVREPVGAFLDVVVAAIAFFIVVVFVGAGLLLIYGQRTKQSKVAIIAATGVAVMFHLGGSFAAPFSPTFGFSYRPFLIPALAAGLLSIVLAVACIAELLRPSFGAQFEGRLTGSLGRERTVPQTGVQTWPAQGSSSTVPAESGTSWASVSSTGSGSPAPQLPAGWGIAPWGARFLSRGVLDNLFNVVPTLAVWLLFIPVISSVGASDTTGESTVGVALFFVLVLYPLSFVIGPLINEVFIQGGSGQTLGRKATHLRLIRDDGRQITKGTAFGRFVVIAVLAGVTCGIYSLVDLIVMLVDPRRQRLTDRMLKLLVVQDLRQVSVPTVTFGALQ